MKLSTAVIASSLLLSATTTTFAQCHNNACRYPQTNTNFFVGAGGSYNNIEYDVGFDDLRATRNCGMKFAPVVQFGFLSHFSKCDDVLFGLKAFYKYLDFKQTVQSLVANTQTFGIQHEYALLGIFAHKFCYGLAYVGAGVAVTDPEYGYKLNTDFRSQCEHETGFTWQVGITQNLCAGWFLDFNYTYTHNPKYAIKITPDIKGNFCTKIQEFMLTINKSFNCF